MSCLFECLRELPLHANELAEAHTNPTDKHQLTTQTEREREQSYNNTLTSGVGPIPHKEWYRGTKIHKIRKCVNVAAERAANLNS